MINSIITKFWQALGKVKAGTSAVDSVHQQEINMMDSKQAMYAKKDKWEPASTKMLIGDEVECVWNSELGQLQKGNLRLGEVYVVKDAPHHMVCTLVDVTNGNEDDEEDIRFNRLRFRIMKRVHPVDKHLAQAARELSENFPTPYIPVLPEGKTIGKKPSPMLKQALKEADESKLEYTDEELDKVIRANLEIINLGTLTYEEAAARDYAQRRKACPVFSGVLKYFPDALKAVATCSKVGNDQHNAGQPLHWDRSKSGDELDALARHLIQAGEVDNDGIRHSAKVAWRALANLQKELEAGGETDY